MTVKSIFSWSICWVSKLWDCCISCACFCIVMLLHSLDLTICRLILMQMLLQVDYREDTPVLCPTKEHPFLSTQINSWPTIISHLSNRLKYKLPKLKEITVKKQERCGFSGASWNTQQQKSGPTVQLATLIIPNFSLKTHCHCACISDTNVSSGRKV